MGSREMVDRLSALARTDIDAVSAYRKAAGKIRELSIRNEILRFQRDHSRHADLLFKQIEELGKEPPAVSPDVTGYFMEGFAAIRSVTGTGGALRAIERSEEMTHRRYRKALYWDLSPPARKLVERNLKDVRRHLKFIREILSIPTWP